MITPGTDDEDVPCGVCRQRLGIDELATCRACVSEVRGNLTAALDAYTVLPELLNALGSNAPKRGGPGGPRERPLLGGDPLVMLGPGSGATGRRRAFLAGKDDHWDQDDRPGDPLSVSYELARWEDDWRRTRHEPAAAGPELVTTAARYLHTNLQWAASHHEAFGDFADDLRRLRWQLEAVTRTADRPEKANTPCFEPDPEDDTAICGGTLQRSWTHKGLDDDWTCRRCRRTYDQTAYWLAVRSEFERVAAAKAAEEGQAV